jgi:uncharacterized protein (DUF305 family)
MKRSSPRLVVAGLLVVLATAACGATARRSVPGTVRTGPREEAGRPPATEVKADSVPRRYSEADVRFMRHMMAHHAQALAMTSLVPTRSGREDLRLLAQRIEASQHDEIALMRRWLEDRGEDVPSPDPDHEHHDASAGSGQAAAGHESLMPGMLTREELARLAAATGADFDRLFLQFMIRHHEGALSMVAKLLASSGAGQEVEIFRFASDVDADQRAEIGRMRTMQGATSGESHLR